jgi:hypothetical protein
VTFVSLAAAAVLVTMVVPANALLPATGNSASVTTAQTTHADPIKATMTAAQRAKTINANLKQAVAYAAKSGLTSGVALFDTKTHKLYTAGKATTPWATESVVKVFIAARLLLTGQMVGGTEKTAYRMITQSDDDAADDLYGLAGGDSIVPLLAKHYKISGLGSPPARSGWWGNTHVTAKGLAIFYAKVKKDPKVGPWLINAMKHTTKIASDGQNQYFGIPAGIKKFAIKQGWGADGDCFCQVVFNSSGFVQSRYTVVLLTAGGSWDGAQQVINHMAQVILPVK